MAKQGNLSSPSHFFRLITYEILENQTLELPTSFVKEHLGSLSKHATLRVPIGADWKMELKRCKGRVWLDKGWQEFVDKYSIQRRYILVFRYEGRCSFNVLIFDESTLEIKYPITSARTGNRKAEKLTQVKEEDEILEELPQKVRKSNELPMTKASSAGGDHVNVAAVTSARDRAKASQSKNFNFTVTLQQTSISKGYLIIPESPARSYFRVMGSNDMSLKGADGRCWCMKFNVGVPPLRRVWITSGWDKFSQENQLQKGDKCAFELVNSTPVIFKVTIDRNTDDDDLKLNKNAPLVKTDVASQIVDKFRMVGSFKFKNPYFRIQMTSYYISRKPKVHISSAHARRYLEKDRHGKNVIILHGLNGKTWPVEYHHYIKSSITKKVEFYQGWNEFASENRLRAGDCLVFEMMNGKSKHKEYNVTIFSVAS